MSVDVNEQYIGEAIEKLTAPPVQDKGRGKIFQVLTNLIFFSQRFHIMKPRMMTLVFELKIFKQILGT